MSDTGDDFREWNKAKQEKRRSNRENSGQILFDRHIEFETKNNGAHLIVEGSDCKIDFWPGTGKYISRNGPSGRGVFNLIKLIQKERTPHKNGVAQGS